MNHFLTTQHWSLDDLQRIIDGHHTRLGRGLPIGALTSQVLANF